MYILISTQLKNCVEQLHALESAVECASDPSRLRILPGSNPSCGDLRERVEKLEVRSLSIRAGNFNIDYH